MTRPPLARRLVRTEHSLGLRLLLFAGAAIALALAAAWLVLGLLFERHSERQLEAELERHGLALVAAAQIDPEGRPALRSQPADPRFARPASGLYWRLATPAGDLRSRSLWDGELPAPPQTGSGWTAFDAAGPFEDRVLVVARRIQPGAAEAEILVEVAADRRPVAAARAAFGRESAVFLAVLWAALAAAAWVQVRLGLRPLARIGQELGGMSGALDARLAEGEHPVEIRPLTAAINAFAERREQDVARARQRARDLAHALKTPITALRLQTERLSPAERQEMTHALSLLSGAVEGELARTGAEEGPRHSAVAGVVDRLFAVIARTPDGARLDLDHDLPQDITVPLGPEAALEAFGALIENAARHARARVEVTAAGPGEIAICDDGPGIPPARRAAALGRGVRLDERGVRHGLGLSIAQQIVEASGGELTLEDAALGGLCVRLCWPPPHS